VTPRVTPKTKINSTTEEDTMNADDHGGLTAGEEVMLEILLRFAAMSPEQQRGTLALIERIKAAELN
jgi:hypothetical protein